MDILTYLPLGLLLLAIGAFAGVLAGLLGVGGGIVLVPAFYAMFTSLGYNSPVLMQICLATSLATIVVTSARSVSSHHKKGAVDWQILRDWAPGIVIGALLGMGVVSILRSDVLVVIFAVLVSVAGLYMSFGRADAQIRPELPGGFARSMMSMVLGFLSVLMGIGGGTIGVPTLTLFGRPVHRAVATAAGFGLLISVPAAISFAFTPVDAAVRPPLMLGLINVPAFLIVIAATIVTAPYGVALAHRTDAKKLRRFFGAFLVLVALNMLRKALF